MKELHEMQWAALSDAGEVRTSYELAARCIREGVPGDFVECGVFAGVQCAAMAKAIVELSDGGPAAWENPGRRVHLFDSFEGIPEPGPQDSAMIAGGNKRGGAKCSLEQVKEYMRTWGVPDELLVYHRGWFEYCGTFRYTAGGVKIGADFGKIALLRLDLDLYEGTLAALDLFYPLLSPGGFCIVDDFALDGCRQACDEYFGKQYPPIHWQKPGGKA